MASSSDESNSVPTEFNISSSVGSSNGRASLLVEKCPVCTRLRRIFFCPDCVRNGDFTHSKARYPALERFAEKKIRLLRLNEEKQKLSDSCQERFKHRLEADQLKRNIEECQQKITLLDLAIQETKLHQETGSSRLCEIRDEVQLLKGKRPKYKSKLQSILRYIGRNRCRTTEKREELEGAQGTLQQTIRENVGELVHCIFPLSEVLPSHGEDDGSSEGQALELAEAQEATYVRGQWIYTDSSRETQHRVVEPCLPSSGNYSAYCVWVAEHKEAVPTTLSGLGRRNPAYGISAALTYTAQLVSALAFYLDVPLPRSLCYSEFCGHEMMEEQFAHKVAKLNANVLYVCLAQHISPARLRPRQTVHNLQLLLDPEVAQLGRAGPFQVSSDIMAAFEESLFRDVVLTEGERTDDSDEDNDLVGEWETVPNLPGLESMPVPTRGSYSTTTVVHSQSRPVNQPQTTASLAGGLMSAAASVASLWRAATGQK